MSSNHPSRLGTPPFAVSAILIGAFGYWWSSPTPPQETPAPDHAPAFDLSLASRRPDPRTNPHPRPTRTAPSRS